jgi:probable rRNA maturation factor
MLQALDLEAAELSILITNDSRMRQLNREHRGKDRPTNVLSFPLGEDDRSRPSREDRAARYSGGAPRLLGDIVISLDTALRQAHGRRRDLLDEIRFLLAHGLLHLLGYDHATRPQKRRMDARTRWLVRAARRKSAGSPTPDAPTGSPRD